jgi:pimeloyl-ACP methyl ester carboxylesterase
MTPWWKGSYNLTEFMQRIAAVPHITHAVIEEAGHMLHHDQPEALAQLIENFLSRPSVT